MSSNTLTLSEHILSYQPKHLSFCDSSYTECPQEGSYDIVNWGKDFTFYDYHDQTNLEVRKRFALNEYSYDEDGNPNKNKFPEMKPFPVSSRAIVADFSKSNVQQKTIEFLKMCGKDVTCIKITYFSGDFVIEILKHLPNLEEINIDYFEENDNKADFKFLRTLRGIKNLDIFYGGVNKYTVKETESYILDSFSKNDNYEKLEDLSLRNFNHISQETIETLLDSLPNLKKFGFQQVTVSEEIIKMIIQKLKKLEVLIMSCCYISKGYISKDFIEKMKIEYPHIKIGDRYD